MAIAGPPRGPVVGSTPTPVLPATRRWFLIDVVVLAAAGVQCFVLAGDTDRWFAWTVAPPLSAAVLGAGYFGSIAMVVAASRATRWVDARVVLVSTFVFSALTLVVTLLHLDRFHLDHGDPPARMAAVAWLVVYAVVPPLVLWLVARQQRAPGNEPVRAGPRVPAPLRGCLVVEAGALLGLGALLWGRGGNARFWPWPLSDLTAQAIAAWLLALGFLLLLCVAEREVARARAALLAVALAATLWVVALVRYHDSVRWRPGGIVAVVAAALLVLTVVGALAPTRRRGRR
jgi:hypothetical protein